MKRLLLATILAAGVIGNLRELRITGDLGTLGRSVVKKHEFAA